MSLLLDQVNTIILSFELTFYEIIFFLDNDECFPMSAPITKENLDKAKHFVLVSSLVFFRI